jgi:hypothetical protein
MTSFAPVLLHNSDPAYASANRRTDEFQHPEVCIDCSRPRSGYNAGSATWIGTWLGAPALSIIAKFVAFNAPDKYLGGVTYGGYSDGS